MDLSSRFLALFFLLLGSPLVGQQATSEQPTTIMNLVMSSQAICYDYERESDTCGSVSFFETAKADELYSFDTLLLSGSDREWNEIFFGEEVARLVSENDYLKLVMFGPTEVEGDAICSNFDEGLSFVVYKSSDRLPWVHERDSAIADVSERVNLLFRGFAEIELGLDSIYQICDVLSGSQEGGDFYEFAYRSYGDGIPFPEEENETIRFYFNKNIPLLRVLE